MKIYNWPIIILLFLDIGCNSRPEKTDVGLLAGYWRIDFIKQKNETFHPKGMNRLLDYYFIEKNNGIRKKVEPSINNNFIITEDQNPFTIIDNGKGIPEDIIDKIFEPFVGTKVGGSGLGLSLVSKIIVDHGGTIECTSRDNKTYFNLNLPVTDINKNEITDYDIHKRLLISED